MHAKRIQTHLIRHHSHKKNKHKQISAKPTGPNFPRFLTRGCLLGPPQTHLKRISNATQGASNALQKHFECVSNTIQTHLKRTSVALMGKRASNAHENASKTHLERISNARQARLKRVSNAPQTHFKRTSKRFERTSKAPRMRFKHTSNAIQNTIKKHLKRNSNAPHHKRTSNAPQNTSKRT